MKGSIYRLFVDEAEYIGSTIQTLSKRKGHHIEHFNLFINGVHNWRTAFVIFMFDQKPKIELLDEIEFTEKRQLLDLERKWIAKRNPVNCFPTNNKKLI